MVSSEWLMALQAVAVLGSWALIVGLEQDADVTLRRKCGSNWSFVRRVAMSRGLPCLRWSTEPKCRKFVVGGVEEASLVSTSAPLFVTYSRVNQWQICCAFVETVHLWRPKRCVVDLQMLGHKSWSLRLSVDGLSTIRCH